MKTWLDMKKNNTTKTNQCLCYSFQKMSGFLHDRSKAKLMKREGEAFH